MIPLAGAAPTVGIVGARAATPDDARGGLDPQIAALADCDLYDAGRVAQAAVRGLRDHRHRRTLLPSGRSRASLYPATSSAFDGLGAGNTRSAELGLAALLLIAGREAPVRSIAATGVIDDQWVGTPDRRPVQAANGMVEKLDALSEFVEARKGAAWGKEFRLLVSGVNDLRQPAVDDALTRLRTALHDQGVTLNLVTIDRVGDLPQALGLGPAPRHPLETAARAGLALALVCVVGIGALLTWSVAPWSLAFGEAPLAGGGERMTPVRSIVTSNGAILKPVCRSTDGFELYRPGDDLAFVAVSPEGPAFLDPLVSFMIASISEHAGTARIRPVASLSPESRTRRVEAGLMFSASLPIGPTPGRHKLALLGWRLGAPSADDIRKRLEDAIRSRGEPGRLAATVVAMHAMADVYLDYDYEVPDEAFDCL